MRLGAKLAFKNKAWAAENRAVEGRIHSIGAERKLELGGPRIAKLARRWEGQIEFDGLALPVDLALCGRGIGDVGQAQRGVDMLDAALGTMIVVEDANRTVLDADVVQSDVSLRPGLFCGRPCAEVELM